MINSFARNEYVVQCTDVVVRAPYDVQFPSKGVFNMYIMNVLTKHALVDTACENVNEHWVARLKIVQLRFLTAQFDVFILLFNCNFLKVMNT